MLGFIFLCCSEGTSLAQIGGGGGGGGDAGGGGVDFGDQGFVDDGGADQGDGGADGGGGQITGGEQQEVEPIRLTREIEDRRNQGFVGPTAPYIEANGFIGPLTGDPDNESNPEDGRFVGGGVNDGRGDRAASESSVLLDRGFTPEENGFTVERRSIRTRLRPAFAAPRRSGAVTGARFQARMTRQPVVRNFGQGVSISVSNRTAVLTGQVGSQAEKEIIKRQLRLEPGVYRIDDRTTIAN